MLQSLRYWLSEHPSIVNFRWSNTHTWGSTWLFLLTSTAVYVAAAATLHLLLSLFGRRRPVPLGPIPALHSLSIALISAVVFVGTLFSAAAEIHDNRWLWRRTKTTTLQWLLCFPLGTRPTGRVFFWSYVFYLSRFLHMSRTFVSVLRWRRMSFLQVLNQSVLLCTSFLWLEYSQSFQVLAILLTTAMYGVVYGYAFWTEVGLPRAWFPLVVNCQVAVVCCKVVCHFGVLLLHLFKVGGGCNGVGAWAFNSLFNAVYLVIFLKFYVKIYLNNNMHDRDSPSWRQKQT